MGNSKSSTREMTELERNLHLAVIANQRPLVRALLTDKVDVNCRWKSTNGPSAKDGITPLLCAVSMNHYDISKLLLESDASVNKPDNHGCTPLFKAAFHGRPALIDLLIKSGARVNLGNHNGQTPLHICVYNSIVHSNSEAVDTLLRAAANIDMSDRHGMSPTHVAAQWKRPALLKLLIENGGDPNLVDKWGRTPLYICASSLSTRLFDADLALILPCLRVLYSANADMLNLIEHIQSKGKEIPEWMLRVGNLPTGGRQSLPPTELRFPPTDGSAASGSRHNNNNNQTSTVTSTSSTVTGINSDNATTSTINNSNNSTTEIMSSLNPNYSNDDNINPLLKNIIMNNNNNDNGNAISPSIVPVSFQQKPSSSFSSFHSQPENTSTPPSSSRQVIPLWQAIQQQQQKERLNNNNCNSTDNDNHFNNQLPSTSANYVLPSPLSSGRTVNDTVVLRKATNNDNNNSGGKTTHYSGSLPSTSLYHSRQLPLVRDSHDYRASSSHSTSTYADNNNGVHRRRRYSNATNNRQQQMVAATLADDDNRIVDKFTRWYAEVTTSPPSLKNLARREIQFHLIRDETFLENVRKLPLPKSLIHYVSRKLFFSKQPTKNSSSHHSSNNNNGGANSESPRGKTFKSRASFPRFSR